MNKNLLKIELNENVDFPHVFDAKSLHISEKPMKWNELVKEGKACYEMMTFSLEQAAFYKMKLCVLVHTHCEIIFGGKTNEQKERGVFSLTKFAKAVGVKPNTLQHWYENFRNINLTLQERENINFRRRQKNGTVKQGETPKDWIFGLSKKERIAIKGITRKVNRKHTKTEVAAMFDRQLKRSKEDRQLDKYIENTVTLSNFLCDKNLDSLDAESIIKIKKLITKCAKHLNIL